MTEEKEGERLTTAQRGITWSSYIGERGESEPPDSWPNLLPTFKMKVAGVDTPEASSGGRLPREHPSLGPGPRALPPQPAPPARRRGPVDGSQCPQLTWGGQGATQAGQAVPAFQAKGLPQVS